jgi:DNA primase catalytic core
VDAENQYFFCSKCDMKGDVIDFLRDFDHEPFWLVLEKLAWKVGIVTGWLFTEEEEPLGELEDAKIERGSALSFYEGNLPEEAIDFLRDQGLTYPTIKRFRLAYASGGLREHFGENWHLVGYALQAGVLVRLNNSSIGDFFENRIIFPHLRYGQVVNLTGLSIHGEKPGYLQIPDPIVSLYNEAALRKPEVLLVETVLDCLSAEQSGFSAAALLGSSLAPESVPRLSRCMTVYVCLKADESGREAALTIGEAVGEKVRIVRLPEGQSLIEYFKKHSKDEFQGLLKEARSPLEMEIELVRSGLSRRKLFWQLFPLLKRMAQLDPISAEGLLFCDMKNRFQLQHSELEFCRRILNDNRATKTLQQQVSEAVPGEIAAPELDTPWEAMQKKYGLV